MKYFTHILDWDKAGDQVHLNEATFDHLKDATKKLSSYRLTWPQQAWLIESMDDSGNGVAIKIRHSEEPTKE